MGTVAGSTRSTVLCVMAPDKPESLIVTVLQHYNPDWDPPRDNGSEWVSCLCPWHGDTRPSASISFTRGAFICFSCGEQGDAIGYIMREEELHYSEAVEYAEGLQPGSSAELRREPARKSGRRVFGESWTAEAEGQGVQSGVRGRTTPWT